MSGSDISGMVKDALMEPIRTMQHATHFKEVPHPSIMGARGTLKLTTVNLFSVLYMHP